MSTPHRKQVRRAQDRSRGLKNLEILVDLVNSERFDALVKRCYPELRLAEGRGRLIMDLLVWAVLLDPESPPPEPWRQKEATIDLIACLHRIGLSRKKISQTLIFLNIPIVPPPL